MLPVNEIQAILNYLKGNGGTWQDAVKAICSIITQGVDVLAPTEKPALAHPLVSDAAVKGTVVSTLEALTAEHKNTAKMTINWGSLLPVLLTLLQQVLGGKA